MSNELFLKFVENTSKQDRSYSISNIAKINCPIQCIVTS